MKRTLMIIVAALTLTTANAVLKEKNLNQTITVLRAELENSYKEQQKSMALYRKRVESQHQTMVSIMQRSYQTSLMLFSQKEDYTFDLTYACHEATEQYQEFKRSRMPYDKILQRLKTEIARYNSLLEALKSLPPALDKQAQPAPPQNAADSLGAKKPKQDAGNKSQPFMLSQQSQKYRDKCVQMVTEMRDSMLEMKASIENDQQHYADIEKRLKEINDYAVKRYNEIQNNIFINGGDNYFTVLKRLGLSVSEAKLDAEEKYRAESINTDDGVTINVTSQWRGPIVIFLAVFILGFLALASLLSNIIMRWLVPKRFRNDEFRKKKMCLTLVGSVVIFALALSVMRILWGSHNFIVMASGLLIELAWLAGAILISLLIRLNGDQIKSGFHIYMPVLLMGFVVIIFRIIFIPNNVVNLVFPPIMLAVVIWQWIIAKRCQRKIPKSDVTYSWLSMIIMAVATVASWAGYTHMAVQVLIWWLFQLTCIQTITCIYDLLTMYEVRYLIKKIKGLVPIDKKTKQPYAGKEGADMAIEKLRKNKGAYIERTWAFDFVRMVVVPTLAVMSVIWSVLWSADVFDLTESVAKVFFVNFINIPDIISLSIQKIATATALWFAFSYVAYLLKSLYKRYSKNRMATGNKPNITLANNIISILTWGSYAVICMMMLHIPAGAIESISVGLAAGLGFAMKDLLNNFFYGLSLMSGRVRVGDYIECDGVRGRVESITYQSTQLVGTDGSVMAFLNSALFSKNFKNLTKNNSYEFVKVPFGVAYGTNVDEVRQMLIHAVEGLHNKNKEGRDIISTKKPLTVGFDEFGDNSINLYLSFWVMVEEKYAMSSRVRETIYNTLNANNIEIPFPQRDVYLKQVPQSMPQLMPQPAQQAAPKKQKKRKDNERPQVEAEQ